MSRVAVHLRVMFSAACSLQYYFFHFFHRARLRHQSTLNRADVRRKFDSDTTVFCSLSISNATASIKLTIPGSMLMFVWGRWRSWSFCFCSGLKPTHANACLDSICCEREDDVPLWGSIFPVCLLKWPNWLLASSAKCFHQYFGLLARNSSFATPASTHSELAIHKLKLQCEYSVFQIGHLTRTLPLSTFKYGRWIWKSFRL